MAVARKTKTKIPAALYAVCVFKDGEFDEAVGFGFDRRAAKAFEGGLNTGTVRALSAELIEVPLVAEQVAAVEAAIEQAIEGELSRGFASTN